MRYGIVSDVHANIQAWKAVLRDMKNEGVDIILCLGDVVGYGPNPAEVLDSCYEHVDYFILGNHDAVIGNRLDSNLFNDNAKYLIEWTRDQLNAQACDFFADMPLRMDGEGFVCAHGELALPGRFGYIYEAQDAIESFTSNQSPLMFVGHTHLPAKFTLDLNNNSVRKDLPSDAYLLPDERYLINVGSVGDPRDGNTAASYCIYDTDSHMVKFRQIPFDIDKFRHNLQRAQLPVNPFFLRVYDGQQAETETIKDMQVMETNQATEAVGSVNRVIRVGEDVKTRRKKLTFSMDDVMQTRNFKAQEATRREAEAQTKKKGKTIVIAMIVALLLVFGLVIMLVKSKQPDSPEVANTIVNEAPDFIKNKVEVINQVDGKDLELPMDKADVPEGVKFDETTGLLSGWTKQTSKIDWTVSFKNEGWYELILEHAKTDEASEVRLRMGRTNFDFSLEPTTDGSVEEKSIGYFEMHQKGRMEVAFIALKPGPESVTAMKSAKLRFHGDRKPNPYGELPDEIFDNFDSPHFNKQWVIKGKAFPVRPLSKTNISPFIPVSGVEGEFCAGSMLADAESKDEASNATGVMISREFEIKHRYINLLARGGRDNNVISLLVDGTEVITKKPPYSWPIKLKPVQLSVEDYIGKMGRLIFRDTGSNVLVFDKIVFSNTEMDILNVGTTELKKERPEIVENKEGLQYVSAGKAFIQGNFDDAVKGLMPGSSPSDSKRMDTSGFKEDILRFEEMKTSSNKGVKQLESGSVAISGSSDREVFTFTTTAKESRNLDFVQVDFFADKEKKRKVGFSGNGNIFLTNFSFKIKRPQILKKGRYVRVSQFKRDNGIMSLAEVQVFSGGKNIALNKTATQSTTTNDAPASRAVDGNTDGNFNNKSVTHTAGEQHPWWEVDLGKEEEIDSIKVFNRTDAEPQRLKRYSVSILDEQRRIIWQGFKNDVKAENTHEVDDDFKMFFDILEFTHSSKDRHPWYTQFSNNKESGWSVHGKQGESHAIWYGSTIPALINEGDKIIVQMHFESNHKKHVPRKVRVTTLTKDEEKIKEYQSKLAPFYSFEEEILKTFKEDEGQKVDFIRKDNGKDIKIKIHKVEDGKIYFHPTRYLQFIHLSNEEIKRRAARIEDGELAFAAWQGKEQFLEAVKTYEFNPDTLVGKMLKAGTGVVIARHDPLILSGRYVEFLTNKHEGSPKFDIVLNPDSDKIKVEGETKPYSEYYPDGPETSYKVTKFDLGVERNINKIGIAKKGNGKITDFVLLVKNEAGEIIWQNSSFGSDLISKSSTFDLHCSKRSIKAENLAKGAVFIKGSPKENWKGLTDGIYGVNAPFAFATEEGEKPREVILDLGEMKSVNAFRVLKPMTAIFNGISVEYSSDNETYTPLDATSTESKELNSVLWTIPDTDIRYVKIRFLVDEKIFRFDEFKNLSILSEFEVLKL